MKIKKIFKVGLIISLIIAIIVLSGFLIVVTKAIREVNNINISLNIDEVTVCKIVDINGDIINKNLNNESNYVTLDNVSPYVKDAFLSIEDKNFYNHGGLNYKRIIKAIYNNVRAGEFVEGASTISQQLVKNKYLTNEKSIERKIKEIYLTLKLEAKEEKDKIFESYLNTIYYGNGAYGIKEASNRFFNKSPNELNLSESCILAGVVKSPSTYSPINNIDNCYQRRNLVLSQMLEDNKISNEEFNESVKEEIDLDIQPISTFNNLDLYSKKVLHEASEVLGKPIYEILNNGYTIYTYQDRSQQDILDELVSDDKYYQENDYGNTADNLTMIMNNKDASISAVAGRSEYDLTSFKRQPGSLIKPIAVYTPALEEKIIYPCSIILDEKITIDNYSPSNVSNVYYGNISVRDAVAKSLNVPAVKLCDKLGIEKCKNYLSKAGIKLSSNDNGLAIALGGLSEGVTLEEITNSYIPLSNEGIYQKYAYISKIISPQKLQVYDRLMTKNNYCNADSAYLMTDTLIYSSKNGTSKKLQNLEFNVASKTGTVNVKNSNLNTDAYSLAYTTEHTISTWFGNYSMDKNFNLKGNNNGGTFPTILVKDILSKLYENHTPQNFEIPDTIISLPIDTISLNNGTVILGHNSPEKYQTYEIFSSKNMPNEISNIYNNFEDIKFKIIANSNSINLSFDANEYFDYYIYKLDNSNEILLDKISNYNGRYSYNDYNVDFNKQYKYYIKTKSINSQNFNNSKTLTTSINKNYNSLLKNKKNTHDMSWIFN